MSRRKNSHIKHATNVYTTTSVVAIVCMTVVLTLLFPFRFNALVFYIISINMVAFIFYGLDKNLAQAGATRVPERLLLVLGIAGGSAGSLLGINYLRHKSRKSSYLLKLAVILIIQAALITLFVSSKL